MSSKSRRKNRRAPLRVAGRPSGTINPTPDQLLSSQVIAHSRTEVYSGPIPSPALLKQYDEIDPGRARRILALAEEQSRHRMGLEKKVIGSDIWRSWAGLVCGFIVALVGFGLAAFAVHHRQPVAASTIVLGEVGCLVWAFISGTNSRRAEREGKSNAMVRRK